MDAAAATESLRILEQPERVAAPIATDDSPEAIARMHARLRAAVGESVYQSWFKGLQLAAIDGDTARLSLPTRFLKSWIDAHYMPQLEAAAAAELGVAHVVLALRSYVVGRQRADDGGQQSTETAPVAPAARPDPSSVARPSSSDTGGSPLDPRLTFDTFVVGRSNTLAHAAAKQIATSDRGERVMFNPLYIHAGVGLGKTHLLQAVTWAGNAGAGRRVLYLTAEKFIYGFVGALRDRTAVAFRDDFRAIDVLAIDDLQFLQGKTAQAEFCHMLNSLIDAGRQVVIAADRPPAELESLDDRVRSRLAGGLVVEMGALVEEMRLAILRSRVAAARVHHPRFDVPEPVLAFVAKVITNNGRDLEGALNRLLAHNKLTGQAVTLELAEREVRDLIRPQEPRRVRIEEIQRIVARECGVSRADILSSRRTANVVRPRQLAMYLAKTMTLRSLPEIGRRFGGRDHTTVLHAVRKIENLAGSDPALAEEIETLRRQLQE